MSVTWKSEQILSYAPDDSSAKSAQGLANARKWVTLGRNERALWGECQGSGSKPYRTEIDLSEPAFKCTCPSRKFPCKHALGLFLLLAENPKAFTQNTPTQWVEEWLEGRDIRTEIGWAQDQDELLKQPGMRDNWVVMGQPMADCGLTPGTVLDEWVTGPERRQMGDMVKRDFGDVTARPGEDA